LKEKDFYFYRINNFDTTPKFFMRNGRYEN
jgi:hypothetical protein